MKQRERMKDETELTHQIRVYADKVREQRMQNTDHIANILSAHAPYISAHLEEMGFELTKVRKHSIG